MVIEMRKCRISIRFQKFFRRVKVGPEDPRSKNYTASQGGWRERGISRLGSLLKGSDGLEGMSLGDQLYMPGSERPRWIRVR